MELVRCNDPRCSLDDVHAPPCIRVKPQEKQEQPYLTTLATKVRPAQAVQDDPDAEVFADAWNQGRKAVLDAARTTRNPLAGVLSAEDRDFVVQLFNAEHTRASTTAEKNRVTRIAHKLGLQNDA